MVVGYMVFGGGVSMMGAPFCKYATAAEVSLDSRQNLR
jgi:hypothetical protein